MQELEGNITQYYRALNTPVQDELNLTQYAERFPWDYYVTGFIVIFNETMDIDSSNFYFNTNLSSEIGNTWKMSCELIKMSPNSIESPFNEVKSEDIKSVVEAWNTSCSIFVLKMTFQRLETNTLLSFWVLAIALLIGYVILWILYALRKKANIVFVTVAGFLLTASIAFIGLFLNQNPPGMTYLQVAFIISILAGITSVVIFSFLITRNDEQTLAHMKILRAHALAPWIDSLKGQDARAITWAGELPIEESELACLMFNHEVVTELPRDPQFKYSKELLSHIETGYKHQYQKWIGLKQEWTEYINDAKNQFELIRNQYVQEMKRETTLSEYYSRGDPPEKYFNPIFLSYLVYKHLYSETKYGRSFLDSPFVISVDKSDSSTFYLDRASFSHLSKGTKEECERSIVVFNKVLIVSELRSWMKNHVERREILERDLQQLTNFLETLSKLIENEKIIRGKCEICGMRKAF